MSELSPIDWAQMREDLADPIMVGRIMEAVMPLHRQLMPNPPPVIGIVEPKRRQRKPSLATALKQARKAGVSVKGATIEAGKVSLEFGEPEPEPTNDFDKWKAKRSAH